jgi:hypothetical protein
MPTSFEMEVVLSDGQRYKSAKKGIDAFARKIGNIMPADRLNRTISRELKNYLDTVAFAMRERHSVSWDPFLPTLPSGPSKGRLAHRSGSLVDEIEKSVNVTTSGEVVAGEIGGGLSPYALIHEQGGVVRAKKSKYLTIPTRFALDSQGVPLKRKARDWPNTFIQTSKRGNLIIFQKRGANIVPLYVLKKSVVIPPRLGLGKTLEVTEGPFIDKLFKLLLDDINSGIRHRA